LEANNHLINPYRTSSTPFLEIKKPNSSILYIFVKDLFIMLAIAIGICLFMFAIVASLINVPHDKNNNTISKAIN